MLLRKEVIERKVARKKAGKRLGNQFHHPSDELSERSDVVSLGSQWKEMLGAIVRNPFDGSDWQLCAGYRTVDG